MRAPNRIGFRSGPAQCWSNIKDKNMYTRYDNYTFLPPKFACVELRTLYTPIMGVPTLFPSGMPRWDAIMKCQGICQSTLGCAHFTLQFPQSCRLAGSHARPLHISTAVSGAPHCPQGHTGHQAAWDVSVHEKFLADPKALTQRSSKSSTLAGVRTTKTFTIAACLLLMASFVCAFVALHRAGRHPNVRRRLNRVQPAVMSNSREHIRHNSMPLRTGFRLLGPEFVKSLQGTFIDESPCLPMAAE